MWLLNYLRALFRTARPCLALVRRKECDAARGFIENVAGTGAWLDTLKDVRTVSLPEDRKGRDILPFRRFMIRVATTLRGKIFWRH